MIKVYEQIFHSWNATYREGKQKQFNYKLENHIERWDDNKQTKTKNGTVPWVVPNFSCKWLQFPQVCVIFTWTSMNILQFIYASHHQGVASKKWLRISTFWHSITIFLFYLHFSCDYVWEVELCLKTRTCSCTEQFRSIKMMLLPMSMMSHTQEAESPVVTVIVMHNILKWETCGGNC
jgi:hypothetical protein